jgi:hypothetical protein
MLLTPSSSRLSVRSASSDPPTRSPHRPIYPTRPVAAAARFGHGASPAESESRSNDPALVFGHLR